MTQTDPNQLRNIDREIRTIEARNQVHEAAGGQMGVFEANNAPADALEAFWRSVASMETCEWVTDRQQLETEGIELPPPTELTDSCVAAKLDELFDALAARCIYVSQTDHLSDRELYERLWSDTLDEEHPSIPSAEEEGQWFIDMVGSGSEEDIDAFLRYYADDATRRQWREDWPHTEIPPHEDPPYDRDRHLPAPPDED